MRKGPYRPVLNISRLLEQQTLCKEAIIIFTVTEFNIMNIRCQLFRFLLGFFRKKSGQRPCLGGVARINEFIRAHRRHQPRLALLIGCQCLALASTVLSMPGSWQEAMMMAGGRVLGGSQSGGGATGPSMRLQGPRPGRMA